MRTTITLDLDVVAQLHQLMDKHKLSFKDAVNNSLRVGLMSMYTKAEPYQLEPRAMEAHPQYNFDKALQLADELEDDVILAKLGM